MTIELAGEKRTLRASFTAIRALETALGKSIVKVIDDLGLRGDISVTDTAMILFYGLRGYNDTRLSLEQVGEAVVGEHFLAKSVEAAQFVRLALNPSYSPGRWTWGDERSVKH